MCNPDLITWRYIFVLLRIFMFACDMVGWCWSCPESWWFHFGAHEEVVSAAPGDGSAPGSVDGGSRGAHQWGSGYDPLQVMECMTDKSVAIAKNWNQSYLLYCSQNYGPNELISLDFPSQRSARLVPVQIPWRLGTWESPMSHHRASVPKSDWILDRM